LGKINEDKVEIRLCDYGTMKEATYLDGLKMENRPFGTIFNLSPETLSHMMRSTHLYHKNIIVDRNLTVLSTVLKKMFDEFNDEEFGNHIEHEDVYQVGIMLLKLTSFTFVIQDRRCVTGSYLIGLQTRYEGEWKDKGKEDLFQIWRHYLLELIEETPQFLHEVLKQMLEPDYKKRIKPEDLRALIKPLISITKKSKDSQLEAWQKFRFDSFFIIRFKHLF
jgi:serine/threonine protein kinase